MKEQGIRLSAGEATMFAHFAGISLQEAEQVKLQDRRDTKYILGASLLPEVLAGLGDIYRVLEVAGQRVQSYESTYYDTPGLDAYLDHHNGHLNRTKVRVRDYVESEVTFFEMKTKDNHSRTVKARVPRPFRAEGVPDEEMALLSTHWRHDARTLTHALHVSFHRAMLASTERGERVTIDLGLSFHLPGVQEALALPGLCVLEVKRARAGGPSPIERALQGHHVLKSPMSKYCVGTALLRPGIKRNRFKPLLMRIQKIIQREYPGTPPLLLES